MVSSVRVDGWPVVEIRYPPEVGVLEIETVGQYIDALLDRREDFAVVHHATSPLDAAARRYLAEQKQRQADRSRIFLKAEAVVTTSPVVRAVLPILNWIFPHPHPIRAFSDEGEARRWCLKMLQVPTPMAS